MARIRTIKPEFFTSSDIVKLTPLSRLFYVSLWCESDRDGRLNWNVETLKLRYFPADNCDIEAMGEELSSAGLIVIYKQGGRLYAEIPQFKTHQVINNREADSSIPARVKVASITRESADQGEGKEGREGKGREEPASPKKPRSIPKTSLPNDFAISERVLAWAAEKGHLNLQTHFDNFVSASRAKAYSYADWDEAFMGAIRNNWAKVQGSGGGDKPWES